MNKPKEERIVKVEHDKTTNKIIILYETNVELDYDAISNRIRQLEAQISHMEFHYKKLAMEIEKAKKELQLLQGLDVRRS